MSLFGDLFSRKKEEGGDEIKKSNVNSKHKKLHSKKKAKHQKKNDKKKIKHKKILKEQAVNSSVDFNSCNQVEGYYRSEREKARQLLKELDKKQAFSLLSIAKRDLSQSRNERHNLKVLEADLSNHVRNLKLKIKELNNSKENNYENIDFIGEIESSLKKLDSEAGKIVETRKQFLEKEKSIIDRMDKIAKNSLDRLSNSDRKRANKLVLLEDDKEKLITEAKKLLEEENQKMHMDKDLLDSIGISAKWNIKSLNKKLRNLRKEKVELMKRKQLLLISEGKAKEKYIEIEKKINKIKKKYKNYFG